ncbi:hypothetical protein BDE36_2465 [Arcticibacter tournemirensis]|nr:hypothetical protein BDE36_2465 [Arcticibacter tournemirensis]
MITLLTRCNNLAFFALYVEPKKKILPCNSPDVLVGKAVKCTEYSQVYSSNLLNLVFQADKTVVQKR